jgi:hypothetical protein
MELSTFVRHEGSLLCSQEPTSEPYPDPAESNPKSLETKWRQTYFCIADGLI